MERQHGQTPLDFKRAPLLLIGRDPDMLGLLREVLLESAFVVSARLLDGFLRDLERQDFPSLIIYDESQPDLDAERLFHLLQESQRGWRHVPMMLLSDVAHGTRVARCLDRGIAEVVDKPFDVDELAGRIRKILRASMASADPAQVASDSEQAGFSGDLAYLNLPDLLINLHQNMRSGELCVSMEDGDYSFTFSRGKLAMIAGPHEMKGRKALFRAIRLYYGKFTFTPWPDTQRPSAVTDYGELPNLVLSAVQESDEFPLLREKLPPHPMLITVAGEINELFASGDARILRPLLQNASRESAVDELIASSHKTDLEAVQDLARLFDEGKLVAAT